MNQIIDGKTHLGEGLLADFLADSLSAGDRQHVEEHLAYCSECLTKVVSAYESVEESGKGQPTKKERVHFMKKINIYLTLAILTFILSFLFPRYFIQLLVATLLLGIKWIVDSKSTKMLIMIYEAWKKGGEKEASRILKSMDSEPKNRF